MIKFIFFVFSFLSVIFVNCVCPDDCGKNEKNARGECVNKDETGKFCVCLSQYSGIDCSKPSIIILIKNYSFLQRR